MEVRTASSGDAVLQTLKLVAATSAISKPSAFLTALDLHVPVSNPQTALQRPVIVFDIDDTLITDEDPSPRPIAETLALFFRLHELGARIWLVTARHPSIKDETYKELKQVGILRKHLQGDIFFAPEKYRKSMVSVSKWKKRMRATIAQKEGAPVMLTVGDQWSDLMEVQGMSEFQELDDAYGVANTPYVLFLVDDGLSIYGLKLLSK